MGCNCKQVKKIQNLFNSNNTRVDKKGAKYFLLKILEVFLNILNKCFVVALFLILIPIIILILISNYIFKDKLSIIIPHKFIKYIAQFYEK